MEREPRELPLVQIPGDTKARRSRVERDIVGGDAAAVRSGALRILNDLLERGASFDLRYHIHPDGKADDERPYELLLLVAYLEEGGEVG